MANSRRGRQINPAFFNALKKNEDESDVSEKFLAQARKSGTLNLSNRGLTLVPSKVWRINLDAPKQGQTLSFEETGDNWWDMVDLSKLILSSNAINSLPSDIQMLNGLTMLDVHDNKLTHLPEELGQLTQLKALNVSCNQLQELPQSCNRLTQLSQLLCQYNKLTQFPAQICLLPQLANLNLSFNEIRNVPDTVASLQNLIKFEMKHNLLVEMCEGFRRLVNLVHVDLSENKLTYLPVLFEGPQGQPGALEIFHLHHNQMRMFPRFNNCPKLMELTLGNNQILELTAAHLQRIQSIVTLNLTSNKLTTLPEEIAQLKNLVRLDLSGNSLESLPNALGNMESLSLLSVDCNPLRSIRNDVIAKGTEALKKLLRDREHPNSDDREGGVEIVQPGQSTGLIGVASNVVNVQLVRETHSFMFSRQRATDVPAQVWDALRGESIHTIGLSHNILTNVPVGVFNFVATLQHLDLSCNKITALPEEIERLRELRTLTLLGNGLTTLPASLSRLGRLLCLDVSQNPLTQLPPCVYELTSLESLLAAICKLDHIDAVKLRNMAALKTLDLQGNDLATLPPELGLCRQLTSLRLEGNPFRAPRSAILAKGTLAILDYLKNRIAE